MYYEYRRYEVAPGMAKALDDRFRDHTIDLMLGHGFHFMGLWQPETGSMNARHYLLRWESLAEREQAVDAMDNDPCWREILGATPPLTGTRTIDLWRPTDYSPRTQSRWPDGRLD